MQESASVKAPGKQVIAASLGQANAAVERAQLCYRNKDGQEFIADFSSSALLSVSVIISSLCLSERSSARTFIPGTDTIIHTDMKLTVKNIR